MVWDTDMSDATFAKVEMPFSKKIDFLADISPANQSQVKVFVK